MCARGSRPHAHKVENNADGDDVDRVLPPPRNRHPTGGGMFPRDEVPAAASAEGGCAARGVKVWAACRCKVLGAGGALARSQAGLHDGGRRVDGGRTRQREQQGARARGAARLAARVADAEVGVARHACSACESRRKIAQVTRPAPGTQSWPLERMTTSLTLPMVWHWLAAEYW